MSDLYRSMIRSCTFEISWKASLIDRFSRLLNRFGLMKLSGACPELIWAILVMNPEQHDELECLLEIVGIFLDNGVHAPQGLDPLQGRSLADPLFEREKPHDVDERRQPLDLEVELVLVLAPLLDDEGLEKTDGRRDS